MAGSGDASICHRNLALTTLFEQFRFHQLLKRSQNPIACTALLLECDINQGPKAKRALAVLVYRNLIFWRSHLLNAPRVKMFAAISFQDCERFSSAFASAEKR